MPEGMRRAWLTVGAVAVACTAGLIALHNPAQDRRGAGVTRQQAAQQPTIVTTPAVLRMEQRSDETRVGNQEQSTTRAVAFRREDAPQPSARVGRIGGETDAAGYPAPIIPTTYGGPAAGAALPAARTERWERFLLRPGLILHIQTRGRPCTVRTDTAIDVFPNNPSLAHRIVNAGSALHFPLQRGQGPMSIHARPLPGAYGTLELRYDD